MKSSGRPCEPCVSMLLGKADDALITGDNIRADAEAAKCIAEQSKAAEEQKVFTIAVAQEAEREN